MVHHTGLKTDLGAEMSSVGYTRAFKEMVFEESLPLSEKKKFRLFGLVLKSRNKLGGCFKIKALIHNFYAIELAIPQFHYIL